MAGKIGIYLSFFILFFALNIFITFRLYGHLHKKRVIQRILVEIDESSKISEQFNNSSGPFSVTTFGVEARTSDARSANLKAFFRKHGSSLYDYSGLIVNVSDSYGFDYRLLPAIAMTSSSVRTCPASAAIIVISVATFMPRPNSPKVRAG